jgi:type II secretory pathway pseudopilin PulG
MLRSLFTLALSVFMLAEASAQTAPATTKAKSAKASARTAARNAKKARRVAIKSAPVAPLNDGWPPLDETAAVASATTTSTNNGWGADVPAGAAATSRGEIDNQNVHAAPGMPIHVRTSNGMVPYSVRPPRKPAAQTTLTPGN